jgi:hypothetical protein
LAKQGMLETSGLCSSNPTNIKTQRVAACTAGQLSTRTTKYDPEQGTTCEEHKTHNGKSQQ